MNITSKYAEPAASFLLPVGEVADLTTSGYGIVHRPNYLSTDDFSDATEDLANVSNNTFEADGNNYFIKQCIRLGGNDGKNYVVINISGTTGTDTITTDRNIEESNGADIFISQYKSLVTILDNNQASRSTSDSYYSYYFIFLTYKASATIGRLNLIFADETQITDFELSTYADLPLYPVRKVVRDNNNTATNIYYCKPF